MGLCCGKKNAKPPNANLEAAEVLLQIKDEEEKANVVEQTKEPNVHFEQRRVLRIREKVLVVGMAVLRHKIYVLSRNPSTITIFAEDPFEQEGEHAFQELDAPWDIASSWKHECLYVTDCGKNTVFKMAAAGSELTPWLTDISYPHTLSVIDPGDQVLMVRNGRPSSLEVLDHEAKLTQRIELPGEIEYPKHAVRKAEGNFFVTGKVKDVECWSVFELTPEGELIRQTTTDSLAECYHLATAPADQVAVADCWKNRMLVFDSELNESQGLELGFSWPRRIQYVEAENQLYVLTNVKPDLLTAKEAQEPVENDSTAAQNEETDVHAAICIYGVKSEKE